MSVHRFCWLAASVYQERSGAFRREAAIAFCFLPMMAETGILLIAPLASVLRKLILRSIESRVKTYSEEGAYAGDPSITPHEIFPQDFPDRILFPAHSYQGLSTVVG